MGMNQLSPCHVRARCTYWSLLGGLRTRSIVAHRLVLEKSEKRPCAPYILECVCWALPYTSSERRISMVGCDSRSFRELSTGANHHALLRLEGVVLASSCSLHAPSVRAVHTGVRLLGAPVHLPGEANQHGRLRFWIVQRAVHRCESPCSAAIRRRRPGVLVASSGISTGANHHGLPRSEG